jgi:hypothetical protein
VLQLEAGISLMRVVRALKEHLNLIQSSSNFNKISEAFDNFTTTYKTRWLRERHRYKVPKQ